MLYHFSYNRLCITNSFFYFFWTHYILLRFLSAIFLKSFRWSLISNSDWFFLVRLFLKLTRLRNTSSFLGHFPPVRLVFSISSLFVVKGEKERPKIGWISPRALCRGVCMCVCALLPNTGLVPMCPLLNMQICPRIASIFFLRPLSSHRIWGRNAKSVKSEKRWLLLMMRKWIWNCIILVLIKIHHIYKSVLVPPN